MANGEKWRFRDMTHCEKWRIRRTELDSSSEFEQTQICSMQYIAKISSIQSALFSGQKNLIREQTNMFKLKIVTNGVP